MDLEVFNSRLQLVEATSSVPGRMLATVIAPSTQQVWSDLFEWDPKSAVIKWEPDLLDHLLRHSLRSTSPSMFCICWLAGGVGKLGTGALRLAGGSYGGSFGYGGFGGMVASASAVFHIVVFLMVYAIVLPVRVLAWVANFVVRRRCTLEAPRVLEQAIAFFSEPRDHTQRAGGGTAHTAAV